MLADPQTLTIGGTGNTLARTSSSVDLGVFTKDDSSVQMTISHQYGKRTRRMVRARVTKLVSDPLVPAQNLVTSYDAYLVIDVPKVGASFTDAVDLAAALCTWLTATTNANLKKVAGGES